MRASARRGVKALTVSVVLVLGCICLLAACSSDDDDCCGPPGFTIDGVTYFPLGPPDSGGARGDKVATLADGRTIYEIPGEQHWFRVADQYGFVFQGSGRPDATTGGEVVDLTGVETIRVEEWRTSGSSDEETFYPVATITDPARVASLVAAVTSGSLGASEPKDWESEQEWESEQREWRCLLWFEAPGWYPVQMIVKTSRGIVWADLLERLVGISVGTAFDGLCPPSGTSG